MRQQLHNTLTVASVKKFSSMKGKEKRLMRLNPRCPELRGAANPNRARYHCPFAVPIRRSSMPRHRGFRMEKLGRNIKLSIFSEMTVKILIF